MPAVETARREIRVAVIDDQPSFRSIAEEVIEATAGFEAVGSAASGEDALRCLQSTAADLVLMDVRMPGIGGVAAARALGRLPRRPVVVLISADACPVIASDPAAHGAAAFMCKDAFGPRSLRRVWNLHAPSRSSTD